jgi:hypothetical protein
MSQDLTTHQVTAARQEDYGAERRRLSLRTFETGMIPTSIVDRCAANCTSVRDTGLSWPLHLKLCNCGLTELRIFATIWQILGQHLPVVEGEDQTKSFASRRQRCCEFDVAVGTDQV